MAYLHCPFLTGASFPLAGVVFAIKFTDNKSHRTTGRFTGDKFKVAGAFWKVIICQVFLSLAVISTFQGDQKLRQGRTHPAMYVVYESLEIRIGCVIKRRRFWLAEDINATAQIVAYGMSTVFSHAYAIVRFGMFSGGNYEEADYKPVLIHAPRPHLPQQLGKDIGRQGPSAWLAERCL